jgi:hypothetical protein
MVVRLDDEYWIEHNMIFGLATAGGHHGQVADATVDIWKSKGVAPILKWVDDHDIFRFPNGGGPRSDGSFEPYTYAYDLCSMKEMISDLGVPWHTSKGQDFAFTAEYIGFFWHIADRSVSLTDEKRLRFKGRVDEFLRTYEKQRATEKAVLMISGSLSHIAFVYSHGRSYLSSLYTFAGSFQSKWASRYVPASVRSDLIQWSKMLNAPFSRSLVPKGVTQDLGIWVDASTSWGIGVIFGGQWDAWKLVDGWAGPGRDIGWLEAVAVEIVCLMIEARGHRDEDVLVRSDNVGVIGAFKKGRGRNFMVNFSIRRTDVLLVDNNLSLSFEYVRSEINLADPISRGDLGLPSLRSVTCVSLPADLTEYLVHV